MQVCALPCHIEIATEFACKCFVCCRLLVVLWLKDIADSKRSLGLLKLNLNCLFCALVVLAIMIFQLVVADLLLVSLAIKWAASNPLLECERMLATSAWHLADPNLQLLYICSIHIASPYCAVIQVAVVSAVIAVVKDNLKICKVYYFCCCCFSSSTFHCCL